MIESEKSLEKLVTKEILKVGGLSVKLLSTHFTGLPDRLCLLPGGRLLFIEVKTTGKKPSKIQILVHNKLRSLGFTVSVIDNSKDLKDLIQSYERK